MNVPLLSITVFPLPSDSNNIIILQVWQWAATVRNQRHRVEYTRSPYPANVGLVT